MVIFERKPYNPKTRESELLDKIEQLEREKSDLEAVIRKNKHEILWLQGMLKQKGVTKWLKIILNHLLNKKNETLTYGYSGAGIGFI